MRREHSHGYLAVALILSAPALLVGLLSAYVPWIGDDLYYQRWIFSGLWDVGKPLDSIADVFGSQANHWMNVNGRFVAHTLVQCFCGLWGQTAFAVVNALVYPLLVLAICSVALRRVCVPRASVVATGVLLVLLSFVTKMMPTCQIGFLWMMALDLLWLWLFFHARLPQRLWVAAIAAFGAFALGICAGNGSEALNVGLGAALAVWVVKKRFRLTAMQWALGAGWICGFAALCASPAMWSRASTVHLPLAQSLLSAGLSARALWLLVAVMLWMCRNGRGRHRLAAFCRREWFWLVMAAVNVAFALAVGVYVNRQLFGAELAAIILLMRLLPRNAFTRGWMCMFTLVVMAQTVWLVSMARQVVRQYDEIECRYLDSPTGLVFFDRERIGCTLLPDMRYHEDVIDAGWADMTKSIAHGMHTRYGNRHPWLFIVPETASDDTIDGSVTEYRPGHFRVFLKKPRELTVVERTRTGAIREYRMMPQRPSLETPVGNIYTLVAADHSSLLLSVTIPH